MNIKATAQPEKNLKENIDNVNLALCIYEKTIESIFHVIKIITYDCINGWMN